MKKKKEQGENPCERKGEGKMQTGLIIYYLIILFIGHKLNIMNYI